ncbi:NAD(P)-dependent oxidoreductase [Pseudohalocynthiibacter aestuariivivens]|nr:NAD(P)-dependent oxidoreductase [Pseudohalocynthiibacter aestuariivivens]QIE46290.1 NAD(P)-dependent oxidoreductase [Pseudohalocynthiibacter aestuariivivens]
MKYGVIGLGNLGGKIASNLLDAGFELQVNDLNPKAAEQLVDRGATWCDDPAAAARNVDGLITCLTSPKISTMVMTGPNGALSAMSPGSVWIETSTTEVHELMRIAELAKTCGVGTIEAPVTGGVHRAARGEITVLLGGSDEDIARHKGAIEAFGGANFHLGGIGAASTLKVITNMLAFVNLIGLGEGLMLAKRAGLDLGAAYRGIQASSGNSAEFESVAPVVLNGSFDTSFTLGLACKDLGLMMELGREHDVPLKFTGLMDQMFLEAKAKYGADAWTPHVVKMMEDATGVELRCGGFPDKMMDARDVLDFCDQQTTVNQ